MKQKDTLILRTAILEANTHNVTNFSEFLLDINCHDRDKIKAFVFYRAAWNANAV